MSKHAELIERLRCFDRVTCNEAADALEAQAREIEGLQAQLAATAKSAFEAMPHDIPRRMKRKICVETGWSMSMVSRAYIELRAAFTGEKYTANADLDAAMSEIEGLRKALAPFAAYEHVRSTIGGTTPKEGVLWGCHSRAGSAEITVEDMQAAIDAVKGAPHG